MKLKLPARMILATIDLIDGSMKQSMWIGFINGSRIVKRYSSVDGLVAKELAQIKPHSSHLKYFENTMKINKGVLIFLDPFIS
jgi:hypothetical protein